MKEFENLVSSSSLGERYPFERITQVVFITAKIAFIFTSLSAVHINDFDIFTVKKKNKPKKNKTKQNKPKWSKAEQKKIIMIKRRFPIVFFVTVVMAFNKIMEYWNTPLNYRNLIL